MRKYSKMIVCALAVITLSGCSIAFKRNYTEDYKKYLTYSLGQYKVLKEEPREGTDGTFGQIHRGLLWEISYTDSLKQKQVFTLDNMSGDETSNYFGDQILDYAVEKCNVDLNKTIVKKYFPVKTDTNGNIPVSATSMLSSPSTNAENGSSYVSDSKGIKLSTLKASELVLKWKCKSSIEVHTTEKNDAKIFAILKTTKLLIADYCTELGINNIVCSIEGPDDEHSYTITYNKIKNSFDIVTAAKIEHDKNYPDGHPIVVDKVIINKIKVEHNVYLRYDTATKQYFVDIRTAKIILETLGYKVPMTERQYVIGGKYASYKWNVANDEYEWALDYTGVKSCINKNGIKLPLLYRLDDDGISWNDLKKITTTVMTVDNKNETIVITGKKL